MSVTAARTLLVLTLSIAPLASMPACAADRAQGRHVADLIRRGRARLEAGQPELALELFDQADAETRGSAGTRVWVLRTWFELGRINDAFDQVDALQARGHGRPDLDYLYGMGSFLQAENYMAQGVASFTTGFALQDAERFLSAALEADPGRYPDAWLPLAQAAWMNRNLEVAERAVAEAFPRAAADPVARYLEGRIHLSRFQVLEAPEGEGEGEGERARRHLARAIQALQRAAGLVQAPREHTVLVGDIQRNLGIALQYDGRDAPALEAYAEAIAWHPAALPYGDYWNALGLEDFLTVLERGARRFEENWGAQTPADATLLWWLGRAYFAAERYAESEATYLRVLAKWPSYEDSWWFVGMSRYHRKDFDGAIAAWHEQWKAEPAGLVASVQADRELHISVLEWVVGWCAERGQPSGEQGQEQGQKQGQYNVKASFLCEVLCGTAPERWKYWNDWGLFSRDGGEFLEQRGREGDQEWAQLLYERAWEAYQKAIEIAPERPHLYNDAAVILHYNLKRDLERALELYRVAQAMAAEQLARGGLSEEERVYVEAAQRDSATNIELLERELDGDGDGDG